MVTDPAGQFWSPYVGMGNNWINVIDVNGERGWLRAKLSAKKHNGSYGKHDGQWVSWYNDDSRSFTDANGITYPGLAVDYFGSVFSIKFGGEVGLTAGGFFTIAGQDINLNLLKFKLAEGNYIFDSKGYNVEDYVIGFGEFDKYGKLYKDDYARQQLVKVQGPSLNVGGLGYESPEFGVNKFGSPSRESVDDASCSFTHSIKIHGQKVELKHSSATPLDFSIGGGILIYGKINLKIWF